MPSFPGSPRVLKGAFIQYGAPGTPPKFIVFPTNPDSLCRTLAPQTANPGAPAAAFPQETIVATIPLDAADELAAGDATALQYGVHPLLAALELLMYPPPQGPGLTTLFVWGPNRVVPVRITSLQVNEQLFEPNLSPIRASVQVTMVVDARADGKTLPGLAPLVDTLALLAAKAYAPDASATGVNPPP